MRIRKLLGSRYGCSNKTAYTIDKRSLWDVASFCPALICVHNQYSIQLEVPHFCCCNTMLPTVKSHASALILYWTAPRESASTGGFLGKVLNFEPRSFWILYVRGVAWASLFSSGIHGATTLLQLGTNWWITP